MKELTVCIFIAESVARYLYFSTYENVACKEICIKVKLI
jgi:hypothetical protein